MRILICLLLIVFTCFSIQAQDSRWEYIWSEKDGSSLKALKDIETFNGHSFLIVEFNEIPSKLERESLNSKGIELLGYLGNNHYWCRMHSTSVSNRIATKFGMSRIASPTIDLKANKIYENQLDQPYYGDLALKLWSKNDIAIFQNSILENEAPIRINSIDETKGILRINCSGINLRSLTMHPAVAYVGPHSKNGTALLDDAVSLSKANVLQQNAPFGEGLSGEGVNVGMWDGGLTGNHVDINGSVTNVENDFFSEDESRHPTHVAGIITSKGHFLNRVKGMAPNSQVYNWGFTGDIIQEMDDGISDFGLNIINSSFLLSDYNDPIEETACLLPGFYVLESSEIDRMVNENPTLIHTIANGNNNSECQSIGGWSGIPIGLQSAKNVINVGWIDANGSFAGGSSVGPTLDGRLKPEVTMKGVQVFGPDLNDAYQNRWGSSMSAPGTAGTIALLHEWFENENGAFPDASLIRSVLCNTAEDDRFIPNPDYLFGYGIVDGYRALEVLKAENYVVDNVSNGQEFTFTVEVPADLHQIKIGLAWTDPQATPGAIFTLVNDLDLKVTAPDASQYLPWILNPGIPFLAADTGKDSSNNIEQVTIQTPIVGTYTVTVTGFEVPFGPQRFAVNYDLVEKGLKFTNPIGGEKWVPGTTNFIRWESSDVSGTSSIDISYDNGNNWESYTTSPAGFKFRNATVPDSTSHECRLRVSSGIYQSISEPFTIMNRVTIVTTNACNNHTELSWDPVRNADDYIIYLLGDDDEYHAIDTVTATNYLMTNLTNGQQYWVAVTARDGQNEAFRSNGTNFTQSATSSCSFANDIGVSDLCSPMGFRYGFDGSLPYTEPIQVSISNYSDDDISNFNICYQREGESAVCELFSNTILNNSTDTFTFSSNEVFSDTLCYNYKLWTDFNLDTNSENDTLDTQIKVIPSYPLPLPYYTSFENSNPTAYTHKHFSLTDFPEWDFYADEVNGRLSIGQQEQFALDGINAITLDQINGIANQMNEAILNLNLDGYNDSTIYFDFAYVSHGEAAQPGDKVWARADSDEDWIEIFNFDGNLSNAEYNEISAINLTDLLIVQNSQVYGSNFQLKLGQEGIDKAIWINQWDGRSFDNIRVYNAGKDIELISTNLKDYYCAEEEGSFPVIASIQNNSLQSVADVTITFVTNTGLNVSETISSINAGEMLDYTFSQEVTYSPEDEISIDVFLSFEGDLYAGNDSMLNHTAFVRPYGNEDYYEDFEQNNHAFIQLGQNSSWELGNPSNDLISESASGNRAWVTRLSDNYNNSQLSYLYGVCFDFSDFTNDPNFAFNFMLEIETDYDYVGLQYSEDGLTWNDFETNSSSYNWYNGDGNFWMRKFWNGQLLPIIYL